MVTVALPSKGAIAQPTLDFFNECGLRVRKPNSRQYSGTIATLTDTNVLFQRVKDIAYKVADGTAQLGVTGYDVIREHPHDDIIIIHDRLGYGHCQLVVAVPEAWIDVESMIDLVDIALDFREKQQRNLRVATTYTNLTRQFLHQHGIHHFTLVRAEGAIEAAPITGYADVIVDLTQTGTTLRENHLRPLVDGTIVESQACLIGNRKALERDRNVLNTLQTMLEYIDAAIEGRQYLQLTANIHGNSASEVSEKISTNAATAGLLGPTISPVYVTRPSNKNGNWFTVTLTIRHSELHKAVQHLREIGATHVTTSPIKYVFEDHSITFKHVLDALGLMK